MNSVSLNNDINVMNAQLDSKKSDALKRTLENSKEGKTDEELKDVSKQFESVFVNMMLKTMRSTIPEDQGYIEKSNATKTYESMLDEEMSNGIAKAGGFGLSDMIYKSLVKRASMEEADASEDVSIAKDVDVKESNKIED